VDAATPPSSSQRASGSSFYTAMRILPQAQRDAMYEIYNFCRCVDDIADSSGPRPQRLQELNEWRAQVSALYQGKQGRLVAGLAHPVRDFNLAQEDFLAVIDGMEMDAVEDIRAPSLATLDLYCDRVASAVGRLSVRVFGLDHDSGIGLSHHLGRALQLDEKFGVDHDSPHQLPQPLRHRADDTNSEDGLIGCVGVGRISTCVARGRSGVLFL